MIARPRIRHRRRGQPRQRRGVAALESAITLSATLLLLAAIVDLGLATLRYNALGHACRLIAREASFQGADSIATSLGPATLNGNAGDGSVVAELVADLLPTMPPANVAYAVEWLSGDNRPGGRVRVVMQFTHQPLAPGLASWGVIPITATSTVTIVN
jgi:Flp pilus assembly protein TadG